MRSFDRRPRPAAAHPPARSPSLRPALSNSLGAAASPAVTGPMQSHFEPLLPPPSDAPWSRTHPTERQADDIGERIAGALSTSTAIGSGSLPEGIRAAAEEQLGVGLPDVRLEAGREGQAKARREGAIAVTEGSTISFGAGQLSTATHRGRALLGHELTHVAQQAAAGSPATQRQTPGSEEGAWSEGMTIAAPPGHAERMAEIAWIKGLLVQPREERDELRAKLDAVPAVTSEETEAERKALRGEIRTVEESMVERLTAQIQLIDESLGDLWAVMPTASEPGGPEVPEQLWEDLRSLQSDKTLAEAERKALQRSRARDEIRDLQDQLGMLGATDPGRKALEERKKELAEYLSGTAERRAAPGTTGTDADGRGYVVYAHSVKVAGSLPWRNNNPGNVQRSPSGGDFPGVLGVDPYKHFIFSSEADGKNAIFLDLQERRGGAGAKLSNALRSYVAGSQRDEDLPDTKEECKARGIPAATCVTKDAARTYAPKVTTAAGLPLDRTLGELTPTERMALVDAILLFEGGKHGARGQEYTCGDVTAPQEYRDLLGCDE